MSASSKTCRLLSMLALTSVFFLIEIVVGYVTNSIALIADSFHMLSDVVALIVGFASIRIAKWPSRKNTYGWARADILGALVNTVFLVALCFSIFVESLKRMVTVEEIENPVLLLAVGVAGLVVNLIGLMLFHNHVHGHSHGGHSHAGGELADLSGGIVTNDDESTLMIHHHASSEANSAAKLPSPGVKESDVVVEMSSSKTVRTRPPTQMNMKGVFLHVLGDALGSVVVIISSLVIWLCEGSWRFYIDPTMSIAMVVIILFTAIPLLKQTSLILLQTTPNFLDHDQLKHELACVNGVLGVHEFHVWQLTGNRIVLSAHITCSNLREYMSIAAVVKDLFHKQGIHSTTIQPEFIELDKHQPEECILPCVDSSRNCLPDTCCGSIARYRSSTKDKHTNINKKGIDQSDDAIPDCVQTAGSLARRSDAMRLSSPADITVLGCINSSTVLHGEVDACGA